MLAKHVHDSLQKSSIANRESLRYESTRKLLRVGTASRLPGRDMMCLVRDCKTFCRLHSRIN